jgi:TnpA family transposase
MSAPVADRGLVLYPRNFETVNKSSGIVHIRTVLRYKNPTDTFPPWEYDNLIQSLYLLNYIDSASLRQNVQRAVNRGESYHRLRRTISYANYGKLRFGTEHEQHLWSECSRLIANCIFYNATLLSKLLGHKESRGDMQGRP